MFFENAAILYDGSLLLAQCSALTTVDVSGLDVSQAYLLHDMFQGCYSLTTLDGISGWDTDSVTDMHGMFDGCSSLASLDGISGWNTGSVTDMSSMFSGCSGLTSLEDISGWNTGKVTTMSSMFNGCRGLTSLDGIFGGKTSKVEDMSLMFNNCSGITSIDLSEWDTSSVTDIHGMFGYCYSLASLNLSGWNTSNVTNMASLLYMYPFSNDALASLNLSSWDTKNATDMHNMFYGCSSLKTVLVGEGWNIAQGCNSDDMFYGCESLVGGAGTQWNANHINGDYARVDGGTANPGYLTGKTPEFKSCYLVLSGEIGVTFTLKAPKYFDAEHASVRFWVGGRKGETVPLTGLSPDGDGRYHVTCHVTSLEMAQQVAAELVWGGEAVTATSSVEYYTDYIVGHPEDYDAKAIRLAKAINDYGYYAQLWLSREHKFALGEGGKYAKVEEAYKTYNDSDREKIKVDVNRYKIRKDLRNSRVKVSYRLHLDAATGISVRVRPESKGAATIDSSRLSGALEGVGPAEATGPESDGGYVLRLDGIPAHRLGDWLVVQGATDLDSFTVEVCALSYARTVFWTSDDTLAKDAMAALLEYYDAAMEYKGVTA